MALEERKPQVFALVWFPLMFTLLEVLFRVELEVKPEPQMDFEVQQVSLGP